MSSDLQKSNIIRNHVRPKDRSGEQYQFIIRTHFNGVRPNTTLMMYYNLIFWYIVAVQSYEVKFILFLRYYFHEFGMHKGLYLLFQKSNVILWH